MQPAVAWLTEACLLTSVVANVKAYYIARIPSLPLGAVLYIYTCIRYLLHSVVGSLSAPPDTRYRSGSAHATAPAMPLVPTKLGGPARGSIHQNIHPNNNSQSLSVTLRTCTIINHKMLHYTPISTPSNKRPPRPRTRETGPIAPTRQTQCLPLTRALNLD